MNDLIESTHVLRRRLGLHLDLIQRLDPLQQERKLTGKIGQRLIKKHGSRCAYCQAQGPVEFAHIVSLEIGGTTVEENLILLCRKHHRLYDHGHLSIKAMNELASEWRKSKNQEFPSPLMKECPPSQAITSPPKSVQDVLAKIQPLELKRHYCKAISIINKALGNPQLDKMGHYYLLIKRAELTRRRSARGVLVEALKTLQSIDPKELSIEYLPVFYYELAYVYRLLGNHAKAAQIIHRSVESSMENTQSQIPSLGYIAAAANEILCLLAVEDNIRRERANEFVKQFQELEAISIKHGEYWGGRWALSCAAHRLQVHLKRYDKKESWNALQRMRNLYYRSDLSNGWAEGARPSMSRMEGLTRVLVPRDDSDIQLGIGLLARAFATRLGPRQRPEGIRDVGFGLVEGIRKTDLNIAIHAADVIERLMNQTVDGTSVLWPWKA